MATRKNIHTISVFAFALILAVLGPAVAAHGDLLGHWPFDNSYTDLAQGNDAVTNFGAPTFTTDAAAGTHALSVGAGDDAAALVSNIPAGASPRTMSFWMKADSLQDEAPVSWGTKDADLHLFEALARSNSTVVGHFWGISADTIGSAEVGYVVDEWLHVAMTYDGTTVRVFGDGAPVGSANFALDTTPGAGNPLNPIFFGGGNTFFNAFATAYSGLIDDVQIYDEALNAGQISFLFNNPGSTNPGSTIASVPEPSSTVLWMLGTSGLGMLVFGRRRRNRRYAGCATTRKHIHTSSVFAFALILAVLGPAVAAHADLLDNLQGYWQFENNYDDSSVSNNDMQPAWGGASTGPTFGAGQVGSALELTGWAPAAGNWEFAQTLGPITSAVTGSNARTMNLWFRADLDAVKPIASYGQGNVGQLFEAITLPGPTWEGHFWGGAGYETGVAGIDPAILPGVTLGQWHMATLVYDGATNVAVYHDGSFAGNYTTGAPTALNTTLPAFPNDKLFVGASNGITPTTGYFDGGVDDVALWNRVLSAAEVQTIYNAGLQGQDLFAAAASSIPEPSTFGLLALGLLSLGFVSGRRRRR